MKIRIQIKKPPSFSDGGFSFWHYPKTYEAFFKNRSTDLSTLEQGIFRIILLCKLDRRFFFEGIHCGCNITQSRQTFFISKMLDGMC